MPRNMPAAITPLERVEFAVCSPAGDPAPTLYAAPQPPGGLTLSATATHDDGDTWLFSFLVPAALAPGDYQYSVYREYSAAELVFIESGRLTVSAAVAPGSDHDGRTHAEKMLAAIEALLEGRAGSAVAQYTIGGRSLTRLSPAELTDWRGHYRREVRAEQARRVMESGGHNPTLIKARF